MSATTNRRPRTGRERLDVEERRRQLVALGLELFGTRAYEDVSIDELARAAGISKGLLYHYFPTKRDFYVSIVREAVEQLLARTKTPDHLTFPERLRFGIDAYLDYIDARGLAYVALLRSAVGVDPEVSRAVDEAREAFCQRLVDGAPGFAPGFTPGFTLAGATGSLDPARGGVRPLLRLVLRGWVAFTEAATLDWVEKKDVTREDLVALLVDLFIQSIGAAFRDRPPGVPAR